MNGQTITAEDIFGEVLVLERTISSLKNKLLNIMPPKYGSDVWWEKMDEEGLKQIKNGETIKFETTKELKKYLGL